MEIDMSNVITETTKLALAISVALEVLKMDETSKTKRQIADEYDIDVKTVNSYAKKYKNQAIELRDKNEEDFNSHKGRRGGKPRNGRWELMNKVFEKYGLETDSATLFEKVNEESVKQRLDPLEKGSFYSMLSIARRSAGISMRNN